MNPPIYLDYNATTPHHADVIAAMQPYIEEHFGNPSSAHLHGLKAAQGVLQARRQVAALLGCQPGEIVFTSGATEANNYALRGVAEAFRSKGNHIITTAIEHPAVTEVCRYLETQGLSVDYLPVDLHGHVRVEDVRQAIRPQTILISVMHANNEVGTIQPLEKIAGIAKEHGILFHTDAAQSVGKIPVRVNELGVDLLSLAGHKLYAPKGIGALYIRSGIRISNLLHGSGHEQGRRPGTENVVHIAGLGQACELAQNTLEATMQQLKTLRDRLHDGLQSRFKALRLNGHPENRLPNTLNVSFPNVDAHQLLLRLADTLAASAGSACHSGDISISPVLQAMQVPLESARGAIRFSVGRMTTAQDIDEALDLIVEGLEEGMGKAYGKTEG